MPLRFAFWAFQRAFWRNVGFRGAMAYHLAGCGPGSATGQARFLRHNWELGEGRRPGPVGHGGAGVRNTGLGVCGALVLLDRHPQRSGDGGSGSTEGAFTVLSGHLLRCLPAVQARWAVAGNSSPVVSVSRSTSVPVLKRGGPGATEYRSPAQARRWRSERSDPGRRKILVAASTRRSQATGPAWWLPSTRGIDPGDGVVQRQWLTAVDVDTLALEVGVVGSQVAGAGQEHLVPSVLRWPGPRWP